MFAKHCGQEHMLRAPSWRIKFHEPESCLLFMWVKLHTCGIQGLVALQHRSKCMRFQHNKLLQTYSFLALTVSRWGNLYVFPFLSFNIGHTISSTAWYVRCTKSGWPVMHCTSSPSKRNFPATASISVQQRNSKGLVRSSLLQWPHLHLQ